MVSLSVDVEPDFPPHFDTNKGIDGLENICELLRRYKSNATFFVCADFLDKNPEIVDLIGDFEVGCHGFRHVDLTRLSEFAIEGEIRESLEIFEEHGFNPLGFRAPFARTNEKILHIIKRFFKYDSSLHFYESKPKGIFEIPIFLGGKSFGVSPKLFNTCFSFPLKNKVFFIHPWEYGGLDFKELQSRRKRMMLLGYKSENYTKNLITLLKKKPRRLSDLLYV